MLFRRKSSIDINHNYIRYGKPSGAGLYIDSSIVYGKNLNVYSNKALDGSCNGSGIFVGNSVLTIDSSMIHDNWANGGGVGGGVYTKNTELIITDTKFYSNNPDYGSYGGGIYALDMNSFKLINVDIYNNMATNGGGLYIRNSVLEFKYLKIESNYAAEYGGGIYFDNCSGQINNLLLKNNNVGNYNYSGGGGGGVYIANSSPIINKATITENKCTYNASSACIEISGDSNPKIINSIIWNNYPNDILGNVQLFYSNILNDWEGEGNSAVDPLFVNPDSSDFSLSPNSPLIDKGIAYFSYSDTILVDMDESEYLGSAPDMGYYEFDKTNSVIDDNYLEFFNLSQNYPNPFNPTTKINYSIPVGQSSYHIVIKIYDMLGRLVRVLVDTNQQSGNYTIEFDANDLTSGIYFYTIQAGKFKVTKKMILLR